LQGIIHHGSGFVSNLPVLAVVEIDYKAAGAVGTTDYCFILQFFKDFLKAARICDDSRPVGFPYFRVGINRPTDRDPRTNVYKSAHSVCWHSTCSTHAERRTSITLGEWTK